MSESHTLPLEVLETIVDLSDIEEARSFAVTCKILLPCSRSNLYSHITLTASDSCQDVPRFNELINHSPGLESFIRHLTIINLHDVDIWSSQLVEILDQLRHLKTLSIVHARSYFGCEWGMVPASVQSAIFNTLRSATLEAVDAQFFEECLSFLQQCPTLKHLDLYDPNEALTRLSISSPQTVLHFLRLSILSEPHLSLERILAKNEHPLLDLSQLRVLVLDSEAINSDVIFGKWVLQIAESSWSSLSELYWEVNFPELTSADLALSLCELPQLQIIVAVCRYNPIVNTGLEDEAQICCSWIAKCMQSRKPYSPLCSSTFTLQWWDDTKPLCRLITQLEGTQSATFSFTTQPSRVEEPALLALQETAARCEIDVKIVSPLESYSPFDHLRAKRPYTRDTLDTPR
ncbi:hypothetical protein DL96DRAFT_1704800 [Flagelloscypha sp. PMI_526]|nr:hypothetical protein DL96DRAFT_1704800 [Flagelloscypha sp. PMI_526]